MNLRNQVLLKVHVNGETGTYLPSHLAWTTVPRERTPVKSLEYEFKNGKLVMISLAGASSKEKATTIQAFMASLPSANQFCPHCNHTLEFSELVEGRCSVCESDLEVN